MILLIIDLLQKFDYKIDETNIKKFLKALQKLEEHQHCSISDNVSSCFTIMFPLLQTSFKSVKL